MQIHPGNIQKEVQRAGWDKIPVRVVNLENLMRGEYSENEKRKKDKEKRVKKVW